MSKMEVLTKEQAARVDRIKVYHLAAIKSFGDQMGQAFMAGAELLAAKEELPHGNFMQWCETYLPEISHRTAHRYMTFSATLAASRQIADGQTMKLLGSGELSEKNRDEILAAVHEEADGKTLTQLYRDLGVIREKKKAGAKLKAPRKLTAEQREKAEMQSLRHILGTLNECAHVLALKKNLPRLDALTDKEKRAAMDACARLQKVLSSSLA